MVTEAGGVGKVNNSGLSIAMTLEWGWNQDMTEQFRLRALGQLVDKRFMFRFAVVIEGENIV